MPFLASTLDPGSEGPESDPEMGRSDPGNGPKGGHLGIPMDPGSGVNPGFPQLLLVLRSGVMDPGSGMDRGKSGI